MCRDVYEQTLFHFLGILNHHNQTALAKMRLLVNREGSSWLSSWKQSISQDTVPFKIETEPNSGPEVKLEGIVMPLCLSRGLQQVGNRKLWANSGRIHTAVLVSSAGLVTGTCDWCEKIDNSTSTHQHLATHLSTF